MLSSCHEEVPLERRRSRFQVGLKSREQQIYFLCVRIVFEDLSGFFGSLH